LSPVFWGLTGCALTELRRGWFCGSAAARDPNAHPSIPPIHPKKPQVYPEHKYLIVEALRQEGFACGMTGDGVNGESTFPFTPLT
jgi:hypothetical protein